MKWNPLNVDVDVDPLYFERAFLIQMHRVQAHHSDLVFNWSDNLRVYFAQTKEYESSAIAHLHSD